MLFLFPVRSQRRAKVTSDPANKLLVKSGYERLRSVQLHPTPGSRLLLETAQPLPGARGPQGGQGGRAAGRVLAGGSREKSCRQKEETSCKAEKEEKAVRQKEERR